MRRQRGFTLIEIVVVIAIVALLLTMATFATRAITIQQRISTTVTRLATVDAALVQFVMVQKRLPCPANGALPSTDPNAGVEDPASRDDASGCTTNQRDGVVPWKTIGLAENDATDGWVRRITYRIDPALAGKSAMDMSGCDPAGSGATAGGTLRLCLTTCTVGIVATTPASCTAPLNFLQGDGTPKGLTVQNLAGTKVMDPANATTPTGAAYVLISHGEGGGGAYLNSGVMTPLAIESAEEQKNFANLPLQAYYVDDAIADSTGATHFDDMLSHPTIIAVVNRAALGPRSH